MSESQIALREANHENFLSFMERMPGLKAPYDDMSEAAYRNGALSGKTKRLMALTASLLRGCRACVLFQTEQALEQGATVDELMEVCAVAGSLGGTMGTGESLRVVAFLKEKGVF